MSKRTRIAVAGLGRIGWSQHCWSLGKHPDYQLVAVADAEADRRKEAQDAFGCAAFRDFDEMLRNVELDAVVIATPTHFHKPMALAALRRGLHVLLEKPMATNLRDAQAIARAARRGRRALTVYQPHRVMAYFQQLLRLLGEGRIGRVTRAQAGFFNYVRRNDWQSLVKFGGGMLNNYGAHAIDQQLAIIGYDVRRVFCGLQRVASLGDAEDVVKIVLETTDGVIGDIDICQASVIKPYRLTVWGTHGALWLENDVFKIRWFDPKKLPRKRLDCHLASAGRQYPSDAIKFREEQIAVDPRYGVDVYADFARAIRRGVPPLVKPEETLSVMRVIERCRKDAGGITAMK